MPCEDKKADPSKDLEPAENPETRPWRVLPWPSRGRLVPRPPEKEFESGVSIMPWKGKYARPAGNETFTGAAGAPEVGMMAIDSIPQTQVPAPTTDSRVIFVNRVSGRWECPSRGYRSWGRYREEGYIA